jgi:hypothetical protein
MHIFKGTHLGCILAVRMKKMLMLEEEGRTVPEIMGIPLSLHGYTLQFLSENESQTVHKVEVRRVNFQDIMRHLRQGDSVLIRPNFQADSDKMKKRDQTLWYFAHI